MESLAIPSGLASNRHGAPHFSAPALLTTAPGLRPELRSAYWLATASAPPGCHLTFSLLAAIAMVESGGLGGHHVDRGNRVVPALIGAPLNGRGRPAVRDTDAGQLDHDPVWDRPIGPLQLVPAVWRVAAVDLDGDGTRDPHNVFDAAGAAMVYLCAEDRDLSTTGGVEQAVRAYNDSPGYLRLVLSWQAAYERQEDQLLDLGVVFSIPPFAMASKDTFWDAVDALLEPRRRSASTGGAPSAVAADGPGEETGPSTSSPAASPPSPSGAPVSPSGPAATPGTPTTTPPATPVPGTAPPAVVVPSPGEPGPVPNRPPNPRARRTPRRTPPRIPNRRPRPHQTPRRRVPPRRARPPWWTRAQLSATSPRVPGRGRPARSDRPGAQP